MSRGYLSHSLWEPEGAVSLCDAVRQTFCNGKNVSELVATCGY